jgi:hypothetical protein
VIGFRAKALAASLCAAVAVAAGCGGDDDPADAPVPPATTGNVTVSGLVTFDFVPTIPGLGLDYAGTTRKPARGVAVQLVGGGGTVLASTTTDAAGAYAFSVAQDLDVSLRVRAEMVRDGSPGWDFRVLDNTASDALYVLGGAPFNTGSASATRNLHAASGWGGAAYTDVRSAAPFAILDVVYDAVQLVLTAAPTTSFPALRVYWSTANVPALGAGGSPDPETGEIGSSFFTRGAQTAPAIFLVGAADDDTDEYDRHVIAHEWGHYLENMFSRSDSIGGRHTFGDQLDMRVAFGEGWGNAFSAMVTGEPVYTDVAGPAQAHGFAFDIEGPLFPGRRNPSPGWYSEESVQELLYDLFDASQDAAGGGSALDTVALGFGPVFAVLADAQRNTSALTAVFPLLNALRGQQPGDAPQIDALAGAYDIAVVTDDYGSAETSFGIPANADLASVYDTLVIGGGATRVCSLDDFKSAVTGSTNKLGSRRFLRVTVASPGTVTFTARAVAPLNGAADPDMLLHRHGPIAIANGAPTAACTASNPAECSERLVRALMPSDYVLEVYEWTNTNTADDDHPPIGRTCFDVTATSP